MIYDVPSSLTQEYRYLDVDTRQRSDTVLCLFDLVTGHVFSVQMLTIYPTYIITLQVSHSRWQNLVTTTLSGRECHATVCVASSGVYKGAVGQGFPLALVTYTTSYITKE